MINMNDKPLRKWTPNIDTDIYRDKMIRVMTYNILCDSLITVSTGIDEKECENNPILKWSERKQRILKEIVEFKSDIVCIQEFEKDEEFIRIMGQNSYDVIILLFSVLSNQEQVLILKAVLLFGIIRNSKLRIYLPLN